MESHLNFYMLYAQLYRFYLLKSAVSVNFFSSNHMPLGGKMLF